MAGIGYSREMAGIGYGRLNGGQAQARRLFVHQDQAPGMKIKSQNVALVELMFSQVRGFPARGSTDIGNHFARLGIGNQGDQHGSFILNGKQALLPGLQLTDRSSAKGQLAGLGDIQAR